MPDLDHDSSRNGLAAILESRTIWSSLVGMGCFLGSIAGVHTELIDQGALTEALLQAATALSFVGAIVFRVTAKRKLTG
jgi:hydroxyethylthiazole kinase-like sugar kinase family protein